MKSVQSYQQRRQNDVVEFEQVNTHCKKSFLAAHGKQFDCSLPLYIILQEKLRIENF